MCLPYFFFFFFFNDTATTEIYTLSLHDALPISRRLATSRYQPRRSSTRPSRSCSRTRSSVPPSARSASCPTVPCRLSSRRSEEHTSELQSRQYLVCRLLLEKKKKNTIN